MSKIQHTVTLKGILKVNGKWTAAKTHQADEVTFFEGQDDRIGLFNIDHRIEGQPILVTSKGKYPLVWNNAGYFEATRPMPCKVHVILKKITGKLIYWA